MQWIYDFVNALIADPASMSIAVPVIAGLAVAVLALGVMYLIGGVSDPLRRRMVHFNGRRGDDDKRLLHLDTILGPIAQYVVPSEELERNKTLEKLAYAGYRSPSALQNFYATKAVLTVGLPGLAYLLVSFVPEMKVNTLVFILLAATAVGLFGPNYFLEKKVASRLKKLRDGFPDALDLLVVCVESGLGLTQALQRVADEIMVSHSELGVELAVVNAEIGAGIDQVTALKNFGDRSGLDDVRGLVSLLVQTLKFGTGVADSLRVYASEFRDKRMQLAEEQAAKIGTKLIFPLIVFMFPGFFIVALGPAVIRLMGVFG